MTLHVINASKCWLWRCMPEMAAIKETKMKIRLPSGSACAESMRRQKAKMSNEMKLRHLCPGIIIDFDHASKYRALAVLTCMYMAANIK